jgi:hypothetical protein
MNALIRIGPNFASAGESNKPAGFNHSLKRSRVSHSRDLS